MMFPEFSRPGLHGFLARVRTAIKHRQAVSDAYERLLFMEDRAARDVVAHLQVAGDAHMDNADRAMLANIALRHWDTHDLPVIVLVPFIDATHVREAVIKGDLLLTL